MAEPEDIPGQPKQGTPCLAGILLRLLPSRSARFRNLLALVSGSLLAGVALLGRVDFLAFGRTEGYATMFVVTSAYLLASIPLLGAIRSTMGAYP